MAINNIPNVLIACCILNNVCEIHRDAFNDLWLEDEQLDQPVASAPIARTSSAELKTYTIR